MHAFSRQICRGGGPSGASDIDWQDVARESLRKFFSTGIHAFRGTGSEKSYLYTHGDRDESSRAPAASARAGGRARGDLRASADHLDVDSILSQLPDECRELLVRAFLNGESYPALAESMGLAESSVRARLSRCIRRARLTVGAKQES